AGAVVMAFPGLTMVEERWIRGSSDFPYVPGLLSFREIPHILNVLGQLKNEPDLFLCDGQGIAHPRGLGLASHLGLITQKPSIGCAKTRLVGEYAQVEYDRGSRSDLLYRGRKVGMVLRTKKGVKPIFISPGYGVTAGQAVEIVLKCTGKYRLPEPIRKAHLLVNRARREEEG
ncbi:MAG: endonuclease V, partial [Thermoplasmata archaeon]